MKYGEKMIKFGVESAEIDRAPFLIKTDEEEENCVRFTISLSCTNEKISKIDTGIENLDKILSNAVPICPDYNERYEITFESYVMYQVRNESYCSYDDYELGKGNYFIVFEKSRLLDVLPIITDCQVLSDGTFYPDKWKHYGIYCLNHIIDVITYNEPIIKKIS